MEDEGRGVTKVCVSQWEEPPYEVLNPHLGLGCRFLVKSSCSLLSRGEAVAMSACTLLPSIQLLNLGREGGGRSPGAARVSLSPLLGNAVCRRATEGEF